ncbi:glycosyltransferase family 2 protein [Nodularia sp. UHCC 0506]|uniref:glycosyltransferase family 2 protein n=1 Tax=Nodularia sp. UHCC 0506 TaxID=3110243 RepID=UPI002B21EF67|nr:glycosyltransferase family 2 protein [Nodularia sp. UHCC 0506]MEA5516705.1 glycosyltransferase family 2 protein [Nodularia sp. UHCC 0506]
MNIAKPLVTIEICTHNRAESLSIQSLSAIEKLTYPNYEVIIVDDCSTDQTRQILYKYQEKIENLYILRNQKNRGLPYSRNRILENAKGEIIVFSDDDVSLFPDCLDEIVKAYMQYPEVGFIWGGVYECHGSNDRNQLTFGTGSLFSLRKIVANHFRFDTNLRYFKTYVCEEHDFARRVQKAKIQIIKLAKARSNHYQAPAKDRPWRSIGGDLNYLYEKVKKNSLLEYYTSLMLGLIYAIQCLFVKKNGNKPSKPSYYNWMIYKEAFLSFYKVSVMLKNGNFLIASKYLFYTMLDIPIRAKIKRSIEAKQMSVFNQGDQVILNQELKNKFS